MTSALLLALLAQLSPPALPSPLTLARAEEIFLAHGLDRLVAEAQVNAVEGELLAAGAHPNPGANVGVLYSLPEAFPGNPASNSPAVWGWTAGLTDNAAIEDELSGKRSLRIKAAAHALAAAKLSAADLERIELSQLRQQFAQALVAGDDLAFAREVEASYAKTYELNRVRWQKGDISAADLAKIATAKLEADQAVTQAESGLRVARAALAFLLGVRGRVATFALAGDLAFRPLPALAGKTPDDLVALGLDRRPDYRAAQAARRAREARLAEARRGILPDLALNATWLTQATAAYVVTPPSLELGISGNLPVLYQQQGEIRRAEGRLAAAEAAEAKVGARVVADVAAAWAGFTAARELVLRMEGQELSQAKLSRDLEELMYEKGAASLLDYLDAERTFIAVNLEYHQELAAYWDAVYQLEQATAAKLR